MKKARTEVLTLFYLGLLKYYSVKTSVASVGTVSVVSSDGVVVQKSTIGATSAHS